jgi:hypothetical protein
VFHPLQCADGWPNERAAQFEFFSNRTNIGDTMWTALREQFTDELFADVVFFQLKDVDLPDDFEVQSPPSLPAQRGTPRWGSLGGCSNLHRGCLQHAIQDAEVSRQYQSRAHEVQTKLLIEARTRVIQAEYRRAIMLQEAEATANGTLRKNHYDIKAFNVTQANRLTAYRALQEQMGLTGAELMSYLKVTAAAHNTAGSIIALGGQEFSV